MKTTIQHSAKYISATLRCIRWGVLSFALAWGHTTTGQVTNSAHWGFETQVDRDNWYADNGIWEAGVPTYGPSTNAAGLRAYAGSHCVATVLAGDYIDDRLSRLIGPAFVVPDAAENPRLRFWHWWSFNDNDWGQVQVSTNNGTSWTALSPQYWTTSADLWTHAWLDLSAYAGQSVLIGFYFESHNTGWPNYYARVGPGWYVDEVTIETGPLPSWPVGMVENFETNTVPDRWVADFGIWQIGKPTSGPATNVLGLRAHSGTNCLATVLAGDYPEDRASRITGPAFTVPSADQNPRLRFWHWWSFNNNDWGQVQISTNNGASWEALSPAYWTTSAELWTRPLLDLSAYAGKTVRIGFYFESHNSGWPDYYTYVSSGWYVNEVTVETGAFAICAPEGFENGWGDWTADFGVWEIGAPTSGPPTNNLGARAYSGTNCAATVLSGDYPEDRSSRLSSPHFMVPPAICNPRLRFWHWWSFSNNDWGQLQISTNNGATWLPLATYQSSSGNWTRPSFDLAPYAGQLVRIGFYFESRNSGWPNYYTYVSSGWYLDEMTLVHDSAVILLGSPIVRTQNTACISLGLGDTQPASNVTFNVQTSAGLLANPILSTRGCWSGTVLPVSDSGWTVSLENHCACATFGIETVASLCFTATSPRSAFVPLTVSTATVNRQDGSAPTAINMVGTRVVAIGREPLLEPSIDPGQRRMVTLYGIAGKTYQMEYTPTVSSPLIWTPAWTNTISTSLFDRFPLTGMFSNSPSLYLRAVEQ